jgi:hypothetical protein
MVARVLDSGYREEQEREPQVARVHASLAEAAIYRIRTKIKYLDVGAGPKRKLSNEEFVSIVQNLNLERAVQDILEGSIRAQMRQRFSSQKVTLLSPRRSGESASPEAALREGQQSLHLSDHVFVIGETLWFPYDGVWGYRILSLDGELVSSKFWLAGDLSLVPPTLEVPFKEFTKDEMKFTF